MFGNSEGMEKDLALLGLPDDGNYRNVRGYRKTFVSPVTISGSNASIDFPSSINFTITDMPSISGNVGVRGRRLRWRPPLDRSIQTNI